LDANDQGRKDAASAPFRGAKVWAYSQVRN
jgi:hypothetical protein